MSDKTIRNVIILGSGPAGLTAAIYASRAGLAPIVFEGKEPGGQLIKTGDVENFPGFPNGISGHELIQSCKQQAINVGTEFKNDFIKKVDFSSQPLELVDSGNNVYFSKAVIIATGASPKWLGLPKEQEFIGKGVTSCAVCDGFFYKNQSVAVVGGGDSACEEALYLSKICSKVSLLVRGEKMRASTIMVDRVQKQNKIEVLFNSVVDELLGNTSLEGIIVKDLRTNMKRIFDIKGLFIAIGHNPNSDVFDNILERDDMGYLKTLQKSTQTNIQGVFVAGDVHDNIYRQAITAAGSGCMAALDVEKYLAITYN